MLQTIFRFAILASLTPAVSADWSLIVDLLDASDPGGPSPAGIVVVDIFADTPNGGLCDNGDPWTVSAINGVTLSGATLRYAYDPDSGAPELEHPGLTDRFVTFFGRAVMRDSDGRFTIGGAYVAGSWCPYVEDEVVAEPHALSVVWYYPTPESCSFQARDWYIGRIAIDLNDPAVTSVGAFRLAGAPPGWRPVFLTACEPASPGLTGATYYEPQLVGYDWGIFVADCLGDLNRDAAIDIADLAILLSHFGASAPPESGDLDGDGTVSLSDLALLLANFGESCE